MPCADWSSARRAPADPHHPQRLDHRSRCPPARYPAPRPAEIEDGLAALAEYRERPAGTIRINATGHAAEYIAWPRLAPLLQQYPDLKVELAADYGLADIVAERYDIGIRRASGWRAT